MRQITFFLVLILTVVPVSADLINLKLLDENYIPGETLQLEIFTQDSVSDITAPDIKLADEKDNEIQIAPIVARIKENHYFVYFDLRTDLQEGVYTAKVKNIKFIENNILKEITETTEFNLIAGSPRLSLNPAVFTSQKSKKSIELQIKNQDSPVQLNFQTSEFIKHPYEREETVKTGTRKFYFIIDPSTLQYNTMGSINITYETRQYTVPVFVTLGVEQPELEIEKQTVFEFITETKQIDRVLEKDQEISGSLGIKNLLNETIQEVTFRLSPGLEEVIELNTTSIDSFGPLETVYEQFTINKNKSPAKQNYEGEFIVSSSNYSNNLPIRISFIDKEKEQVELPPPVEVEETKKEEKQPIELFELPPPVEVEEVPESKAGLYTVIIIVLIFAAVIYKLTRKQKQQKSFKEYLGGLER